MTDDVFSRLKRHYESIVQELRSQAEQAHLLDNTTDIGTEREQVYLGFLKRFLPKSCDAFLGGYVFDIEGNSSKQTDIIVTSGDTPRFQTSHGQKYIAPLEGTIAVAEVKSELTRNKLYDALTGCAHIPDMPRQEGIVAPYLQIKEACWKDIPYKIVFAYNGIAAETALAHITEYYQSNSDIPLSRRPNIIHVLGRYVIVRITSGMSIINSDDTLDDDQIEIGQYKTFGLSPDVASTVWILNELHRMVFWSSHLMYKYDPWHNNIVERIRSGL